MGERLWRHIAAHMHVQGVWKEAFMVTSGLAYPGATPLAQFLKPTACGMHRLLALCTLAFHAVGWVTDSCTCSAAHTQIPTFHGAGNAMGADYRLS